MGMGGDKLVNRKATRLTTFFGRKKLKNSSKSKNSSKALWFFAVYFYQKLNVC
jgi:hypothetical protein